MRRFHVLAVLLALVTPAAADNRFNDLTPYLPLQANAVAVIDVQGLYASRLAQKEKWATERPLPIPPTLTAVALAAKMDPGSFAGGRWEVGVGRLRTKLSIEQIAEREKGAVETVAGAQAVLSLRNAYFVEIQPPLVLGMMHPADRQELGRWIREVRNTPLGVTRLQGFLQASITTIDPKAQFVLAIDATDLVSPEQAKKDLAAAPALAGKTTQTAAVADVLGSLRGVKLTVSVAEAIRGELRFEFAAAAAPLVPFAKPLLTGFLSHRGASVKALEKWTVAADGTTLVLAGELPEKGLRRILSLVAPAPPPANAGEDPLAGEIRGIATMRYYQSIQAYLDDLRKPTEKLQQDYPKFATWYDSFTQRIEQLSTYNVDEDVVRYGKATATRLRGIAASLRGDVVDVQELEKSITVTPYVYATSGWGRRLQPGVWLESNEAQIRARQQQAVEKGTQVRQDLWSRIDNDTTAMQQTLAQRAKAPVNS